jgi:hypothetical protein
MKEFALMEEKRRASLEREDANVEKKGELPNGRREGGTPVKEIEEETKGELPNGRRSRAMMKLHRARSQRTAATGR